MLHGADQYLILAAMVNGYEICNYSKARTNLWTNSRSRKLEKYVILSLRDNALTGNLVSIKVGNLVSLSKMQNLIA